MNPQQHADLEHSVGGFKQQFLECLDRSEATLVQNVKLWRQELEASFHAKLTRVEEMLAGPYNRELTWDWVEDERHFTDVAEFMRERRVRLHDDPTLEMSGKEYFDKYARGGLTVLKVLEEAGFFVPPANRFFQPFCKQIVEGTKSLLRVENAVPVYVPEEQVDLAFSRTQELISTSQRLQRYCPLGIPVLTADKEFFINVVNSLTRLPYKVVLPLSDAERRDAEQIRHVVESAQDWQSATVTSAAGVQRLREDLQRLCPCDVQASAFLNLVDSHRRQVRKLLNE